MCQNNRLYRVKLATNICVCVFACARVCECACVRACACMRVCAFASECTCVLAYVRAC